MILSLVKAESAKEIGDNFSSTWPISWFCSELLTTRLSDNSFLITVYFFHSKYSKEFAIIRSSLVQVGILL